LDIGNPKQPVSWAEDCDVTCINRGKISFTDSRTAFRYCMIKLSCYVSVRSGPSSGIQQFEHWSKMQGCLHWIVI